MTIEQQLPSESKSYAVINVTQEADGKQARCFIRHIFWFLFPLILLICFLEAILWAHGENWPVERVIEAQRAQPDLLWQRGYFSQDLFRYKFIGWQQNHPQIMALGSSRVMQFRTPMFGGKTASFYNAGGMARSVEDLACFSNMMTPQTKPRVLIMGVDIWWLNDHYVHPLRFERDIYTDSVHDWRGHARAMQNMLNRPAILIRNLFAIRRAQRPAIGWLACLSKKGVRVDGSHLSGPPLPNHSPNHVGDSYTLLSIKTGTGNFKFSNGINAHRFQRFRDTLIQLKQQGVLVLGFAPPLATREAKLMAIHPLQRQLWQEYRKRIPTLFAELGFPFCDASQPAKFGLNDSYMRDGMHANETFHLYVMRHWLRDTRVRAALPHAMESVTYALNSPLTTPWSVDYRNQD